MYDLMEPLIHKATLRDISVNITRAGLSINDPAMLQARPDGQLAVLMQVSRRFLGLFPHKKVVTVGLLAPHIAEMLGEAVQRGEATRVRIVGLTPEHLTLPGQGPEIHISIWGDPRRIRLYSAPAPLNVAPVEQYYPVEPQEHVYQEQIFTPPTEASLAHTGLSPAARNG